MLRHQYKLKKGGVDFCQSMMYGFEMKHSGTLRRYNDRIIPGQPIQFETFSWNHRNDISRLEIFTRTEFHNIHLIIIDRY